jgi:hypothetical protein
MMSGDVIAAFILGFFGVVAGVVTVLLQRGKRNLDDDQSSIVARRDGPYYTKMSSTDRADSLYPMLKDASVIDLHGRTLGTLEGTEANQAPVSKGLLVRPTEGGQMTIPMRYIDGHDAQSIHLNISILQARNTLKRKKPLSTILYGERKL